MKKIILLTVLLFSAIAVQSQTFTGTSSLKGKITGTVIDSITKAPVDYASISISKINLDKPLTGTLTDASGTFKLNEIQVGTYTLTISFIGYKDKTIKEITTTDAKLDFEIGEIALSPETNTLKEVVIVGTAQQVVNKIDKIVYNVEKDLTAGGGNATDVLQKVPMVNVDINGNVSIRGDANVRVLINGKPSGATSANLADVLKTIPADQIKNIEVVTSPSAKYDAEGSAGIINIITKQKSTSGVSGSVSGGIGTRQNNFNANINYNKNRFSLSANVGFNNGWPQESSSESTQAFDNSSAKSLQVTKGINEVKRSGLLASVNAGYDFNTFNSLTTTFRYNKGGFERTGTNDNQFTDYMNASNSSVYKGESSSKNAFGGFDWNLNYAHKFSKEGHELTFSSQWSHSIVETNYQNIYSSFYTNQKANNDGANNEYTLQLDYTLPVTEKFKLEAGGKSITRRISSDFQNYVPDSQNAFVFDPISSNLYNYNQDVTSIYSVGTVTLPKGFTVMAGARFENTAIKGDPTNELQTDLNPFTIKYGTFIPSFTLQKALSQSASLKLTYSKRISRPSLTYLNPFINKSNIQAQTQGNPTLDPEISQTVELGYSTFSQKRTINISAYYKYTADLIEGIATPLQDETGTITNYQNIGSNKSFGMSFFGSVNPFKILTLRGNFNAFTYKPDPTGIYSLEQSSNGTSIQYSAFVSGTLQLKNNIAAEAFIIQNSSKKTLQGTSPAFNLMVFGVKKQFWNKAASLGVNIVSPFKKELEFKQVSSGQGFSQSSTFKFPIRSFGLTFSYNFGSMKFTGAKKKGINNDDLKEGEQNNQGGGMPAMK
jgi:outer membrane receptor protein involved in Fe transport